MAVSIRYMGGKKELASQVAQLVARLPRGPCLDLFSGMCSVAGALADSGRVLWTNDIQHYAALVANSLLTSQEKPLQPSITEQLLYRDFRENLDALKQRFRAHLDAEAAALNASSFEEYRLLYQTWKHAGNDLEIAKEVQRLQNSGENFPYRLVCLTFSHGYFGLAQALEFDSLRFAIDQAGVDRGVSDDHLNWYLVCLLQTASRLTSSPGHFAEYLSPNNPGSFPRIRRQRVRPVFRQFLRELLNLQPYGRGSWRRNNRIYRQDALKLVKSLASLPERPSLVYADPPYSRAQYSRYYHVLETLALYDYPTVVGKGRYRTGRFQTPFSQLSRVHESFGGLFDAISEAGICLVLSYPSAGLLYKSGHDPVDMLKRRFKMVETHEVKCTHSTLGGAPGWERADVTEQIYLASNNSF